MDAEQAYNSALKHYQAGRLSQAIEGFRRVLELLPNSYEAHVNLANVIKASSQTDVAIELYRKALSLAPENPDVLFALGAALLDRRDFAEAIACLTRVVSARPGFAEAHYNLGLALELTGQKADAVAAYRTAISRNPNLASAYSNLGGILQALGETDEALAACRKAIELDPNFADAYNNLGAALFNSGQIDAATAAYQRATDLAPNRSDLASNVLFTLYYDPNCDFSTILSHFDSWNNRFAEPLKKFIQPHNNERSPDRRLKIGYVSPNFRAHAETAFVLPLLEHHNRAQFEIVCYSDAVREDAVSGALRNCVDKWRETAGLGHGALADLIRADQVDIAIDLTMHMAGGRLESLARKPAPIQVAWLAYPGTTGLATMDYRFTDSFVDPPNEFASHYTERCFRLSRTFACYDPAGMEPMNSPSPSTLGEGQGERPVTFGCLNNVAKLNESVLSRFAAVLSAVPHSKLHLLVPPGQARHIVLARLARFGIHAPRVSFVGKQTRAAYMNEFHKIDISLDTLPYCGHTTSLDSLWMGVPVITRIGTSAAGRVGWSIMNNLHLTDLAARDDDEFVQIAVKLAADPDRRAELRRTLRPLLRASPIMDGAAFARDIEAAYRQMWQHWVNS
jgi:predicted O-linked N-acetylglucosamine transferase (SPINDLY family)